MTDFFDFLSTALGAPTDKLFIVAGLLFLGVAVVGGVTGYIRPGPIGRIVGGLVGPLLIVVGIGLQLGGGLRQFQPNVGTLQMAPIVGASQPATLTPRVVVTPTAGARSTATPFPRTTATPFPKVSLTAFTRPSSVSADPVKSIGR